MMLDTRGSCGAVLVVDDDPAVLELIQVALEDAGYLVSCTCSGAAAITVAAAEPISAAVIDVNLPDRSGYEVCHEIRRLHGPGLPIVFVSGDRIEAYDRVGGLLLGADDYLVKPVDPGELLTRLDALVQRARAAPGERPLTPRELEVLTLLAEGLTQREIADQLEIASKTVATHIERVLGKLGVRSRAQAVALAYRETLVSISA